MAVETQVLFQEPEQVLNGKSPQVHAAQVLRGNLFWTRPEEPQWTLGARGSVFLQELYADD